MRLWGFFKSFRQYKPTEREEDSKRLADRLTKGYLGGQIQLTTKEGHCLRGPVSSYEQKGGTVHFHLQWLAKKRIISNSPWHPEWVWEFTHLPIRAIGCNLAIEVNREEERGAEPDKPTETDVERTIDRFHQSAEAKDEPKRLFFTTTIKGEKGILFKKDDPLNLQIVDDEIIDPRLKKKHSLKSLSKK